MEVAGLLASLPGIFQSCVHGYRFVSTMLALDDDLKVLHIQFQIEETRFLLWGHCWGWDENEPAIEIENPESDVDGIFNLPGTKKLIGDILQQIKALLKRPTKIVNRYTLENEPNKDESSNKSPVSASSLNRALSTMASKIRGLPGKFRWALDDRSSFKEVLDSLVALNTGLENLLPRRDRKRLQAALPSEVLAKSEEITTNAERDQIVSVIMTSPGRVDGSSSQPLQVKGEEDESSNVPLGPATEEKETGAVKTLEMEIPKQWFKALDANKSGRTMETISIPRNDWRIREQGVVSDGAKNSASNSDSSSQPQDSHPVNSTDQVVLVEWKGYRDIVDSDQVQMALDAQKKHISRHLFRSHNTSDEEPHYVLPCLGYVVLDDSTMGLVFTPPIGCTRLPQTLNKVLEAAFESISAIPPALEMRVQLARKITSALYQLQCAGWLHRQISSHNILFFYNPSRNGETAELDLSQPYLAGWQTSRHDDREKQQVSGGISSWRKYPYLWIEYAYMHPRRPKTRFRRSYDVYSVGVVLAEIAFWEPIGALEGLKSNDTAAWGKIFDDLDSWSEKVYSTCEKELGGEVGGKYCSAVLWCLRGFYRWQAEEMASGKHTEGAIYEREIGLEKGFFWNVVNILDGIQC